MRRRRASDAVAGVKAFERKLAFAGWVRAEELAAHAQRRSCIGRNLDRVPEIVALAREARSGSPRARERAVPWLGAREPRRAAAHPRADRRGSAGRRAGRVASRSRPEILFVLPDYFTGPSRAVHGRLGAAHARRRARRARAAVPRGARRFAGLEFGNVESELARRICWTDAPGMNAFRGEAWMPEPCRSCDERDARLRRLPLPGLPAHRRRRGDRPGLRRSRRVTS